MKNEFFDLPRFWHLSKKTMVENWINIIGITIAAIVLMLIFFQSNFFEFKHVQNISVQLLIISSSILTTLLFNKFSDKSKSTDYLLFPASSFEKIFVVLMIVYLFHIGLFMLFHQIFVHYYYEIYLIDFQKKNSSILPEKVPISDLIYFVNFKMILFYQIFIMMGSLIFKQNSYFKSLLTFIIICFFIFCINKLITYFLFENINISSIPYMQITVNKTEFKDTFRIENKDLELFNVLVSYILPFLFLLISYFKLKEKEV